MPTEQVKFFCAHPQLMGECFNQCSMCERKERELKMAKEQPLFLLVAFFKEGRNPLMERSTSLEDLQKFGENLLRNDSKCLSFICYKPISRTERAEFITDNFI